MILKLPDYVKFIIDSLENRGFETYAVGGCVRDMIMGIEPDDFDIATSAEPEQVKEVFEKTYDSGIKHGTVTVVIGKDSAEVTTFRTEGIYKDSRRPSDVFFVKNIDEDLKRRDFTINSMAYNEKHGIVDLYRGIDDIRLGVIRCVGNPDERFREDALRMLRGVRFSCKTGFRLCNSTKEAIIRNAPLIGNISKERIRNETEKALCCMYCKNIALLHSLGLSKYVASWLDLSMRTENRPGETVGQHMIKTVEYSPTDRISRWAAFLHDVGKPYFQSNLDFPGHEDGGAVIADQIMKELKFDNKTRICIRDIIKYHGFEFEINEAGVRRAIAAVKRENFYYLLNLMEANAMANGDDGEIERVRKINHIYERVKSDPVSVAELKINGSDLKSAGIYGKDIGEVLGKLLDMVIENNELNERELLLNEAKKMMAEE